MSLSSWLRAISMLLFLFPDTVSSNSSLRGHQTQQDGDIDPETRHALRRLARVHRATKKADMNNFSWLIDLFADRDQEANDQDEFDYIVEFHDNMKHVRKLSKEIAKALNKRPNYVYTQLIQGFTLSGITETIAEQIRQVPGVEFVEKDERVTMDGMLRHLDSHHTSDQSRSLSSAQETPWGVAEVGAVEAAARRRKPRGRAFVIDTGVDIDHPDLNIHQTLRYSAFGDDANDENGHGTQ